MKKFVLTIIATVIAIQLQAQSSKIGVKQEGVVINNIGVDVPDQSAVLDVNSSDKGVIFPRLTAEQKSQITNPAEGLLIYNLTTKFYEYFNGTEWLMFGTPQTPPNAPTNLVATAISSSRIDLSWTDNSDDETGFIIERKTGAGGIWTEVATLEANMTIFSDNNSGSGFNNGEVYHYRIKTTNNGHDSEWGNEINVTIVDAFISTWKTDNPGISGSSEITLPLESSGIYDFVVDWGDGNSDAITTWNQTETTHIYTTPGTYTVTINGTINGWRFNNTGDKLKLLEVSQWGSINLGNSGGYFRGAANFNFTATDILDLTGMTNGKEFFRDCQSLNANASINDWDVSEITSMDSFFKAATIFNQDISAWDVGAVVSMKEIFAETSAFNQNIGSWDVSAVTTFEKAFYKSMSFNQNIGDWSVSAATNMSQMFQECIFNQNISAWDVSNVTTMAHIFRDNFVFNQPIGEWDVSSVANFDHAFNDTDAFTSDITEWNTIGATNMNAMFLGHDSFNQNIEGWDVSLVTNFAHMFSGCAAFNQPIGTWNTASGSDFESMFFGCTAFDQPLNSWNMSSATNTRSMFEDCLIFNQNLNSWDTRNISIMSEMFNGAESFNGNITSWVTEALTKIDWMFSGATDFNQDIGSWNTSLVTAMNRAFSGATTFDQDIGGWNTSNVVTMDKMFIGTIFNQDISEWDITQVASMIDMFSNGNLSNANYNLLLLGWSGQNVQSDVVFHAGSAAYNFGLPAEAKAVLEDTYNWTITDSGEYTYETDAGNAFAYYTAQGNESDNFLPANGNPKNRLVEHNNGLHLDQVVVEQQPSLFTGTDSRAMNGKNAIGDSNNDDFLEAANATNWAFLNDGSAFTASIFFQPVIGTNGDGILWDTRASGNEGATLSFHGPPEFATIRFRIYDDSGSLIVNLTSDNSKIVDGNINCVIIRHDGGGNWYMDVLNSIGLYQKSITNTTYYDGNPNNPLRLFTRTGTEVKETSVGEMQFWLTKKSDSWVLAALNNRYNYYSP